MWLCLTDFISFTCFTTPNDPNLGVASIGCCTAEVKMIFRCVLIEPSGWIIWISLGDHFVAKFSGGFDEGAPCGAVSWKVHWKFHFHHNVFLDGLLHPPPPQKKGPWSSILYTRITNIIYIYALYVISLFCDGLYCWILPSKMVVVRSLVLFLVQDLFAIGLQWNSTVRVGWTPVSFQSSVSWREFFWPKMMMMMMMMGRQCCKSG